MYSKLEYNFPFIVYPQDCNQRIKTIIFYIPNVLMGSHERYNSSCGTGPMTQVEVCGVNHDLCEQSTVTVSEA